MQTSTETVTKEYTEADGTVVRVQTTTTRSTPMVSKVSSVPSALRTTSTPSAPSLQTKSSGGIQQLKGPNQKFEQEFLKAHNDLRALHGCPPLKLNPTV